MDTNTKLMIAHTRFTHTMMMSLGKNIEELGLSTSSYSTLDYLNNVGMTRTQELAKVTLLTSGSITSMVNQLEAKGYIKKIPCTKDKRVTWVAITDFGKEVFQSIQEKHLKYLTWVFEDFSEEEKLAFTNQIKHFGTTIQRKIESSK